MASGYRRASGLLDACNLLLARARGDDIPDGPVEVNMDAESSFTSHGFRDALEAQGVVAFQNLQAAEEAFRIAELRYEEGVADFQTVLTSQNTLFSTRNSYLDNKLLQLNAMIGLFQALGGGWQADSSL